jgi:hypothetical protein
MFFLKTRMNFRDLPVLLMLAIYFPASIYGVYFFRDIYAVKFLVLLAIFVVVYYWIYLGFSKTVLSDRVEGFFWSVGDQVNWPVMAWLAVVVYLITICIAAVTVDFTPLGAALRGGSVVDIADGRASFLANRTGAGSLLRYSAVILGRAVIPFLVVYGYWSNNKFRHLMLMGLLLCYFVFLEKALPIFVFLPLILLFLKRKKILCAVISFLALCVMIALLGFLAKGGLHSDNNSLDIQKKEEVTVKSRIEVVTKNVLEDDRLIHFYPIYLAVYNPDYGSKNDTGNRFEEGGIFYLITMLLNRSLWIPYVTAYDWLKFQDVELNGELTFGRSIGPVSWLMGEPKLQIERMVYKFEGLEGDGASNAVFLVDAKIAFGWCGVFLYCIIFTLIARFILTSTNEPAKIASLTSFFTVCLSPLTASILSGGLFFYILICLLVRPESLRLVE